MSTDHLMLALTLDQSARRLLERVGDIAQLREAAMQKLGKNHTKFSRDIGEQPLPPTSDLDDLGKTAREAAAEREQAIAISDLINAFPKVDGRLTYAAGESSRTVAVIDTIEKGLVPRVDDAVTRIEGAILDAMQRQHQSVQSLLQDLSSRQSEEWQRQQRNFMDEVRRQVREAADIQFAVVLKDLNENFERKLAESKAQPEEPVVAMPNGPITGIAPTEESIAGKVAGPSKSGWNWLTIL
ncbi:MAG: Clp protease N-terminal domain-containing protein [Methyloceanibacter sp.]|nr:Clp protease N-terminal domain-containing protein [Methyloceanibacter sp.]